MVMEIMVMHSVDFVKRKTITPEYWSVQLDNLWFNTAGKCLTGSLHRAAAITIYRILPLGHLMMPHLFLLGRRQDWYLWWRKCNTPIVVMVPPASLSRAELWRQIYGKLHIIRLGAGT
jgi:hypothetical protein